METAIGSNVGELVVHDAAFASIVERFELLVDVFIWIDAVGATIITLCSEHSSASTSLFHRV